MSFCQRLSIGSSRLRVAAFISLTLLAMIGGSLAFRSVRARAQEPTEVSTTDEQTAQPRSDSSLPNEVIDKPNAESSALSPANAAKTGQPAMRQTAFTVIWTRTETSADGQQSRLLRTTTRYQRADGLYKLVQTYPAGQNGVPGRAETYFGFIGLGLFRLDEAGQRLVFTTPEIDEQPEDVEAYLRSDPRFNREEDVRGLRSIVWRTSANRNGRFIEEYRAPVFGGLLVKRVEKSASGRQVFEPTTIELGEPAANLFAEFDRYPADYARYEQSIAQAVRERRDADARLMRESMRRIQAIKPDKR